MSIEECKACGRFIWQSEPHRCPPVWEVRVKDWVGDDWEEVYASDAEEAATKYVENYEQHGGEYDIASGWSRADVEVRKSGDDDPVKYEVSGETLPSYYISKRPR